MGLEGREFPLPFFVSRVVGDSRARNRGQESGRRDQRGGNSERS